jgi:hypothetical protein
VNSVITAGFRERLGRLPEAVRHQASRAYALWRSDPRHPSLQFKRVSARHPIYSARVASDIERSDCGKATRSPGSGSARMPSTTRFWLACKRAVDVALGRGADHDNPPHVPWFAPRFTPSRTDTTAIFQFQRPGAASAGPAAPIPIPTSSISRESGPDRSRHRNRLADHQASGCESSTACHS